MPSTLAGVTRRLRRAGKAAGSAAIGHLAVGVVKVVRLKDPDRASDLGARLMRLIGPLLSEHKIGRANLRAAFPEKPDAEIEAILAGVWDNLGRIGAEFAHLDRLWDYDPDRVEPGRVEFSPGSAERFVRLRDDGKPALVFAAHLANWELPALAATAHDLPTAVLYRRPNIAQVDHLVREVRSVNMGTLVPTNIGAPLKLAKLLAEGMHVAMLVDQYAGQGVDVTFFGRPTKANALMARLARHAPDCPIHGVRVIRLPGHRFRADLTEAIEPTRDADGEIDVQATMQTITSVVEGWVREYPEQWLWLHRRWR